jgi:hypothetical protein
VRTWRQDVTGEADAAVGRATAGVLGLPGADIVVSGLAELLDAAGGTAAR